MWLCARVVLLVYLGLVIGAAAQEAAAEKMQTRLFNVPPEFTSFPFSLMDPPRDVLEVLQRAGIASPPGATARLYEGACLLAVTNTPANLGLVQAFVEKITMAPAPCVTTLVTVIEGPEEMIREAGAAAARSSDADATPQLLLLLDEAKKAGAQVRVVGECFLEAPTGTRATAEAVREHTTLAALEASPQGGSTAEIEVLREGLSLELETTRYADEKTLETAFSLQLPVAGEAEVIAPRTGGVAAPVVEQPRTTILQSQFKMAAGHTRLAGMVRPAAGEVAAGRAREGALWAAFLTMKVREAVQPEVGRLIDIEDSPAPGLMAAVFKVPQEAIQTPLPLKVWLGTLGVTFGPGAEVSHRAGLLRVTNTLDNIVRISALVERAAFSSGSRRVPLTVQTFEAPAALVRGLVRETLARVDDSTMLAAVEAAAARGEARRVDFLFLDSRVAERSSIMTGHDEPHLASVAVDAQGRSAIGFTSRHVGSDFAAQVSVLHNSRTLHITFSHEMHPAMPEARRHEFFEPAAKQKLELPLTDFHVQRTTTGTSLPAGGTKLLSMHRPTGRAAATAAGNGDVLWVTFLHAEPTLQLTSKPPDVPHKTEAEMEAHWQAWSMRTFRVPQDFLARHAPHSDRTRTQAIDVLKGENIPFPQGAEATFDPFTSRLEVKNTRASLRLVELYVATLFPKPPERRILTAQMLQGPGTLLRRLAAMASPQGDHRAVVDELLAAVKEGTVQHLCTARIETKADSPALFTQGPEREQVMGVSIIGGEEPVFEKEKSPPGWRIAIEINEFLNADNTRLERVFDSTFRTTAPQERREHVLDSRGRRVEFPQAQDHLSQINTHIAMPAGAVRLLSIWKPTGSPELEKQDVLQVMFITCDVLRE